MKKAYLVRYDSGSYDTFYVHNVGICFTEEKAKEMVEKVNEAHKIPQSMFEPNPNIGTNPRSYYSIQYEVDTYVDDHPDEFPDPFEGFNKPYHEFTNEDHEKIRKISDENDKKTAQLLLKYVMKTYPEWDEETAKKAIELEDTIETLQQMEYGRASYTEINVFESDDNYGKELELYN